MGIQIFKAFGTYICQINGVFDRLYKSVGKIEQNFYEKHRVGNQSLFSLSCYQNPNLLGGNSQNLEIIKNSQSCSGLSLGQTSLVEFGSKRQNRHKKSKCYATCYQCTCIRGRNVSQSCAKEQHSYDYGKYANSRSYNLDYHAQIVSFNFYGKLFHKTRVITRISRLLPILSTISLNVFKNQISFKASIAIGVDEWSGSHELPFSIVFLHILNKFTHLKILYNIVHRDEVDL